MRKINILALYLLVLLFYSESKANSLNILSLNMWSVPFQRQMTFARTEAVGKVLAQNEYDVILFQEAFTNAVRGSLLFHIGKGYHNIFQRAPLGKLNSGVFNLSKFKILKSSFMPYRICGGIQCTAKKGIMYMKIELSKGIEVDIFNHHTQAYDYNQQIRKIQLEQLKAFVDSKNDGSIPVIIAGDFNINGNGEEYPIIKEIFPRMKDVWHELYPNKLGNTWDPIKNYWASIDADLNAVAERLDYILIRDGKNYKWQINETQIVFDQELPWNSGLGFDKYVLASDHYGVMANLSLLKD